LWSLRGLAILKINFLDFLMEKEKNAIKLLKILNSEVAWMKKMIISIALICSLSTFGIVNAAEVNDVPADHWAYPAVKALIKDGIIDGFSDGAFKRDKLLTRYEMAQIVEKAMGNSNRATAKQKALIDKLASEFALEINNIDVRVNIVEHPDTLLQAEGNQKKLEKTVDNSMNVKFDYLFNYSVDSPPAGKARLQRNQQWSNRFRIYLSGDINDNLRFDSRINTTTGDIGMRYNSSGGGSTMAFGRAYFTAKGYLGFDKIIFGRQMVRELGGAVMYQADNNDGITLEKKLGNSGLTAKAGYFASKPEDTTTYSGNGTGFAELKAQVSSQLSVTGVHFVSNIPTTSSYLGYTHQGMKVEGLGSVYKMGSSRWVFTTEFDWATLDKSSANVSKNPHGYSLQLTNATWLPESFGWTTATHIAPKDFEKVGFSVWVLGYHYMQAGLASTGLGGGAWPLLCSPNYGGTSKFPNADGTKGMLLSYQVIVVKNLQFGIDVGKYKWVSNGQPVDTFTSMGFVAMF
jgi:hypothetical protein